MRYRSIDTAFATLGDELEASRYLYHEKSAFGRTARIEWWCARLSRLNGNDGAKCFDVVFPAYSCHSQRLSLRPYSILASDIPTFLFQGGAGQLQHRKQGIFKSQHSDGGVLFEKFRVASYEIERL